MLQKKIVFNLNEIFGEGKTEFVKFWICSQ